LIAAMRTAGVKQIARPAMHASGSPSGNVREIDREIEDAASESKRKFSVHDLSYIAIDGILHSVKDRYTVFLTPKEFAGLNQGLDGGDFGGTGIVIQVDDKTKYIAVENVIPDGPADKAGVQQDDLITSIDGATTKGMAIATASGKLRGKEGTRVTLTIQRDTGALAAPLTIVRAKIHQLSVYEKLLPGKIGYIALTVFGRDTGSEMALARWCWICATTAAAISTPRSLSARSSFRADPSFPSNRALRTSPRWTPTTPQSPRCPWRCW
jgi:C-terminal processing protease CtpA/Prc